MRARLLVPPVVAALLLLAGAASGQWGTYDPPASQPEVEQVIQGGFVTTIAFAADGTIVFGELVGPVKRLDPGASKPVVIFEPDVIRGPEWGLTGLALAPDFDETGDIFVVYTTGPPGTDAGQPDVEGEMRVVRVHEGEETIIYNIVATRGHNSGRALVHDDILYISNGDHKKFHWSRDPSKEEGKLLRMTLDGAPAPGNPHEEDPSWHPYAWTMGHRNPFGLVWDEGRNRLVMSEAGNHSNEEINVIVRGADYGWPACEGPCDVEGTTDPILTYEKVITPVGMAVHGRDYYVGGFSTSDVRRVYQTENGWTDEVVYVHSQGILDVEVSPDGRWLYFGSWNGLFRFALPEPVPVDADDPDIHTDDDTRSPPASGGTPTTPGDDGPLPGDESTTRATPTPGFLALAGLALVALARGRRG